MNADAIRNTGVVWGTWRQSALKSISAPIWLMIREAIMPQFSMRETHAKLATITRDQRPTDHLDPRNKINVTCHRHRRRRYIASIPSPSMGCRSRRRQIHTSNPSWSNWYRSRGRCTSWSSYLHHLDFLFLSSSSSATKKVDDRWRSRVMEQIYRSPLYLDLAESILIPKLICVCK